MKVAIISWDSEARTLYQWIRERYAVDYVIERDHTLWDTDAAAPCRLISFGKAYQLYRQGEIDAFIIPCMRGINVYTGIYLPLLQYGVSEDDVLYAPLRMHREPGLTDTQRLSLICRFMDRTDLDFLVLHVTEHCNLRCANCSMFAGLVKEPATMDLEITKKAVLRLKQCFDQVLVLKLIGGEPFLNPELGEYCRFLRQVYPLADIEIATNGTKILGMDGALLKTLQTERITLDVTYYPVLNPVIDELNAFLNESGLRHYFTQEIALFTRLYDLQGRSDPESTFSVCRMKFNCVNMKENRIAVCHAPFALPHARDAFGITYTEEGWIDLMQEGLTAKILRERMNRPMELCRYCNRGMDSWRQLTREQSRQPENWSIT